jgi:hypothetical protein
MRIGKFSLLAAILLTAAIAFGQAVSGDLVGTVVDSTGAVVPNATVEATNQATNVKSSTTTNSIGEYHITNLLAGAYDVTATAKEFAPKTVKNVMVQLNQTTTTKITVGVGKASTTVEVSEAPPPIDTTTAQLETTYDLKQSADLPIAASGSGILNLSLLQSGVGSSGGIGAGSGPSVGGQRPRNNNFTVEGVDNNDKGVTGPLITVPNDAVQNFTILQNQYSPEFGHSTGGQFNQTVLSGTNQFHGRLYEYMQNRNLNAIDTSNKRQGLTKNPRFDDNRFGGQVGGPIIRNKLFFFANYTYEPIGQAATPSANVFAPTAAGFTQLSGIAGVSQPNVNLLKSFATATSACNPGVAGCPKLVVGGQTISVGVIPIVAPNFTNNKFLVTSMDYNLGANDQIRGRYIYNQSAFVDTNATLPAFFLTRTTPFHLVALSEYHTFSPSVTNEFRVGFNRNASTVPTPTIKALPTLDAFPNLFLEDLNLNLGPDPNAPQFAIQNLYQGTDNLTWIKGKHSFKFGVDWAEYISPQSFTQRARGDYDYTNSNLYFTDQVPDDLAERSLGNNVYYGNQHWTYVYANDIWKIRPNVSITLGLRYEFLSIPQGWGLQALNSGASAPGLITFAAPKAPGKDFAPRVGFAWSPGSSGNTSIRGGFGMGYDVLYDNIGVLSLPPQLSQTSDCPGGIGCAPDNAFLAGGGIKPNAAAGVTQLTRDFCINVQGIPASLVPDDAHCARLFTASFLPSGTPVGVKYPQSYQWNLGVQHLFFNNYTFETRYVGTEGVHLNVQNRLNRIASVDATHNLPVFTAAPTQATLDALPNTLRALQTRFTGPFGGSGWDPVFAAQGFNASSIVGFVPFGHSSYHGLQTQVNRRFTNGLQFQVAHTWSHTIDNSTADFFSTVLSPRRPQDFRNLQAERSNSALDRAHRFTVSLIYDVPWLKHSNWLARNVAGNWEIAPIYTYETGEWANIQSGQDANLNGDAAGDRAIFNPSGTPGVGSDVTALCKTLPAGEKCANRVSPTGATLFNAAPFTVAYLVNNPSAQWFRARPGVLATSPRNTYQLPPINNWDVSLIKRIAATERYKFEFGVVLLNALNHHQFIAGHLNDIASIGQTGAAATTFLQPQGANFEKPQLTFPSNARAVTLAAKFIF